MPNGGIRIVEKSCEAYRLKVDEDTSRIYHNFRKTHNDGVFDVYTPDIRAARSSHLLTGLPDRIWSWKNYRRLQKSCFIWCR